MSKDIFKILDDRKRELFADNEIPKDTIYNDWYKFLSLVENKYNLIRSESVIYNADKVMEVLSKSTDQTIKVLTLYNDLQIQFADNSAMAIMAVVLTKFLNTLDREDHVSDSKYKGVMGALYTRLRLNPIFESFFEEYSSKETFLLDDFPKFQVEDPFCKKIRNENTENCLNKTRIAKLDEIIEILQKGNWKEPATTENIVQLLNTIYGKDLSMLDDEDTQLYEKMWELIEHGRGERIEIVSANFAGYFAEQNLLKGSPQKISNDLFGNNNHINNINKGKSGNRSIAFDEVIPFLNKYVNKIILQK